MHVSSQTSPWLSGLTAGREEIHTRSARGIIFPLHHLSESGRHDGRKNERALILPGGLQWSLDEIDDEEDDDERNGADRVEAAKKQKKTKRYEDVRLCPARDIIARRTRYSFTLYYNTPLIYTYTHAVRFASAASAADSSVALRPFVPTRLPMNREMFFYILRPATTVSKSSSSPLGFTCRNHLHLLSLSLSHSLSLSLFSFIYFKFYFFIIVYLY